MPVTLNATALVLGFMYMEIYCTQYLKHRHVSYQELLLGLKEKHVGSSCGAVSIHVRTQQKKKQQWKVSRKCIKILYKTGNLV